MRVYHRTVQAKPVTCNKLEVLTGQWTMLDSCIFVELPAFTELPQSFPRMGRLSRFVDS